MRKAVGNRFLRFVSFLNSFTGDKEPAQISLRRFGNMSRKNQKLPSGMGLVSRFPPAVEYSVIRMVV